MTGHVEPTSNLRACVKPADVTIDASAIIGAWPIGPDGYGRQNFGVQIGSGALLGPNVLVYGGRRRKTWIGARSIIVGDVTIGHDVLIGEDCYIAPQSGFAGDVEIGDRCRIGAQVGVANGVKICADVVLLARAGVTRDIKTPGVYGGTPARLIPSGAVT